MRTFLVGGLVLLVVLVAFVAVIGSTLGGGSDQRDCSAVQLPAAGTWASLPRDEQHDLASDLVRCDRLVGRSTAEVAASLGAPSATGTNGDGSPLVVYALSNGATSSGVENDPDRLALSLGSDGRVAAARIDLAQSSGGGPIR